MAMLQHRRRRSIGSGVALALAVGGLALGACGKGDSSRDEIAKAFAGPPPKDDKKEVEAKMKALKAKADADAEKARTDELIQEVRKLVEGQSGDISRLRQLADDLRQLAAGLAAAEPAHSRSSGPPGSDAPHDVVDAEYTRK